MELWLSKFARLIEAAGGVRFCLVQDGAEPAQRFGSNGCGGKPTHESNASPTQTKGISRDRETGKIRKLGGFALCSLLTTVTQSHLC